MALASTQLSERGGSIPVAYHVTNLEQSHERYKMLRPSIADDETYDGDLVGLPVVCLSTTLYDNNGDLELPSTSPYPRTGTEGRKYQRVKISLSNFQGFDWWRMNNHDHQFHLLFTRANGHWSTMLRKSINTTFERIDQADCQHLTFKEGLWRVNAYRPGPCPIIPFVNIFVLKPVQLDDGGCEWDIVTRNNLGQGKTVEFSTNLSHCKNKWIWKKVVNVSIAEDEDIAIQQLEELKAALTTWMNKKSLPKEWQYFEAAVVRQQLENASDELLQSVYYILCEDEE